ncbi:hypothetical protein AA0112_g11540 [Alternaria arborescens]|nr:hypothetical protein AA0112_g11540 [Alternaria arborescens]
MTAVAGALGSVIGYLGAEVAEPTVFERLLWPQRFYNYASLRTLLVSALMMPMGGPLHKAALETLDAIRENGLYRGATRGHMLGTAFFHENDVKYFNRIVNEGEKDIRNGFWVEVLRMISQGARERKATQQRKRASSNGAIAPQAATSRTRATQPLFTLTISEEPSDPNASYVTLSEDKVTFKTILGIVCSELSTIIFAVVIGVKQKVFWLTGLLALPLVLKLISLLVTVRRETFPQVRKPPPTSNGTSTLQSSTTLSGTSTSNSLPKAAQTQTVAARPAPPETQIYEVILPSLGFTLLVGKPNIILPFFRHYGYPLRETRYDRFREICCLVLIYLFVLYFPAGLIALLWMPEDTQYVWLGYQVYAIVFMHLSRLFGLGGTARTEDRIARLLEAGKEVCLQSGEVKLWAKLQWDEVASVEEGRKAINATVVSHCLAANYPCEKPYPKA